MIRVLDSAGSTLVEWGRQQQQQQQHKLIDLKYKKTEECRPTCAVIVYGV